MNDTANIGKALQEIGVNTTRVSCPGAIPPLNYDICYGLASDRLFTMQMPASHPFDWPDMPARYGSAISIEDDDGDTDDADDGLVDREKCCMRHCCREKCCMRPGAPNGAPRGPSKTKRRLSSFEMCKFQKFWGFFIGKQRTQHATQQAILGKVAISHKSCYFSETERPKISRGNGKLLFLGKVAIKKRLFSEKLLFLTKVAISRKRSDQTTGVVMKKLLFLRKVAIKNRLFLEKLLFLTKVVISRKRSVQKFGVMKKWLFLGKVAIKNRLFSEKLLFQNGL
jgi:hypothetical protein